MGSDGQGPRDASQRLGSLLLLVGHLCPGHVKGRQETQGGSGLCTGRLCSRPSDPACCAGEERPRSADGKPRAPRAARAAHCLHTLGAALGLPGDGEPAVQRPPAGTKDRRHQLGQAERPSRGCSPSRATAQLEAEAGTFSAAPATWGWKDQGTRSWPRGVGVNPGHGVCWLRPHCSGLWKIS